MTHYDTLQIAKDAGESDVKRAYRSMSLQWHPDRNSAPEAQSRFQEINEAYETLSDSVKRSAYDDELDGVLPSMFGMNSGEDMQDINHILNMMFGQMHTGPNMGGPNMGQNTRGGPNMGGPQIHVFRGGGPGMPGFPSGFPPGFPSGFQTGFGHGFPPGFPQGFPPGFVQSQMQKPPPIIKGVSVSFLQAYGGCTLPVEVEKWSVVNDIKISEMDIMYVPIPAGVDEKEIIILRECGNSASPELNGDVKFVVSIEPGKTFERRGMDLIYKKAITLKESLCGFSFELSHPSGKQLLLNNLTNRTIIKPNYHKVISNLGMVRDGNSGNLVIEFGVEFPDALTVEQMDAISAIL